MQHLSNRDAHEVLCSGDPEKPFITPCHVLYTDKKTCKKHIKNASVVILTYVNFYLLQHYNSHLQFYCKSYKNFIFKPHICNIIS